VSDHCEQELAKALAELKAPVEKLAQERASTEAVLIEKRGRERREEGAADWAQEPF
jgi:hypothetical protein